jgi:urease accessory protein
MNALLQIQTNFADGITRLGNTYFTPPFKVANITENKQSNWLQLMIMSSSPGILDGDEYKILIEMNEGSCLHLHSQSYQRLFQMKKGASQHSVIRLGDNCSFTYIPHPCVPHEHSSFKSTNKIYLSGNCNLIWGEVLTCGRNLNGEVFRFSSYHTITEVYKQDKLVLRENLLMQPSKLDQKRMGQLEGFTHQASFVYFPAENLKGECIDLIHEVLTNQNDIEFGITQVEGNGIMVRMLGRGAELLYNNLLSLANMVQEPFIVKPAKPEYAS